MEIGKLQIRRIIKLSKALNTSYIFVAPKLTKKENETCKKKRDKVMKTLKNLEEYQKYLYKLIKKHILQEWHKRREVRML